MGWVKWGNPQGGAAMLQDWDTKMTVEKMGRGFNVRYLKHIRLNVNISPL